ncbi:MAG: hypothetical protein ACP5I1_08950, partial [Candidatus Hinthialibacter sp.]
MQMNILTPAQEMLLQSIIKQELGKNEASLRLSVESTEKNSIVLSVQRNSGNSSWEMVSAPSYEPVLASIDEALRQILSVLSESGGSLLIERGDTRQRVNIEKGKIFRETLEKRPAT